MIDKDQMAKCIKDALVEAGASGRSVHVETATVAARAAVAYICADLESALKAHDRVEKPPAKQEIKIEAQINGVRSDGSVITFRPTREQEGGQWLNNTDLSALHEMMSTGRPVRITISVEG